MCRVSDASGSIQFDEVKVGSIRKSDLDTNVCETLTLDIFRTYHTSCYKNTLCYCTARGICYHCYVMYFVCLSQW